MLNQRLAKAKDDHKLKQCLINHDLLDKETNMMTNDLFQSNPLSKCFEFVNLYPASADILIEYCLSLPKSKCVTDIFVQVGPQILKSDFQHRAYSKFFTNPELDWEDLDISKIPNTFSQLMVREDLPKYGDGKEYLNDFSFSIS